MAARGLSAAVALLSAANLAYEILLVRVFTIEHFHHIAYMAVGVAMLGLGASGTLVALAAPWSAEQTERRWRWSAAAGALTLVGVPAAARLVPLELTQLPWDPSQLWRLATLYALLALPFAATSLAILIALRVTPERTGRLYGASFAGAGAGALLAVAALWWLSPSDALWAPAILGSGGALAATGISASGPSLAATATAGAAALLAALHRSDPRVNAYKGLAQVEAFPEARRVAEVTSPVGWVVAVDAPAFRYAPGLSLGFRGAFPLQTGVFVDGEVAGAVSDWRMAADREVLRWLPTALPYAVAPRSVLVLGAGSGTDVDVALAHGASRVVAVELHPALLALAPETYRDPRVQTIAGEVRGFVGRSRDRFDLVSLGPSGTLGATAAGVHALGEDFMHTVEAYGAYLQRLTDRGVLAITQWLRTPPRNTVRTILTVAAALRDAEPTRLPQTLVVARSWGTATVLAKPSGFLADEIAQLQAVAASRGFDLDWFPGIDTAKLEPMHVLGEPALTRTAAAALTSRQAAAQFARQYPFRVAPATDARPYPHHFLDRRALWRLLRTERGSWLPFVEWGYLALVATLAQSTMLAGILILVPVMVRRRRPGSGKGEARRTSLAPVLAYFSAIGLAYLAAEIAVLQQFQLLLGHPVYAVAVTLAGVLVFSGVGSAWSDRWNPEIGRTAAAGLALALALYALVLLPVAQTLTGASLTFRAFAGLLLLAPVGALMGCPFPTGVRRLVRTEDGLAWAWAANGFASAVTAPLAALIAVEWGSRVLLLLAGLSYGMAALVGKRET